MSKLCLHNENNVYYVLWESGVVELVVIPGVVSFLMLVVCWGLRGVFRVRNECVRNEVKLCSPFPPPFLACVGWGRTGHYDQLQFVAMGVVKSYRDRCSNNPTLTIKSKKCT